MATKKISALTELEIVAANDYLPIVDASTNTTKRVLLNSLLAPAYYVDSAESDQGATGSGRTLKDLVDTISTNEATIVFTNHGAASTTYTLTTSETVPSNITLVFQRGAQIDGAGTLTVHSPENIVATPRQQMFGTSITVAFTVAGEALPNWWGTTGTSPIQKACDSLPAGGTLLMSSSGNWAVATTITPPTSINFMMEGDSLIIFSGSGAVLDFSTTSNSRRQYRLNLTRTTDWTAGNSGAHFGYSIGCDIFINAIGFEKGLYLESDAGYTAYNRITLGDLWSCKYGVYMEKTTGFGVSRNEFFGGRISCATAIEGATDRYGIYIDTGSSNRFFGCEIVSEPGDSGGEGIPIHVKDANGNMFVYGTIEGGTIALKVEGSSRDNEIIGVVGSIDTGPLLADAIDDTSDWLGTNGIVMTNVGHIPTAGLHEVFPFTDVFSKVTADSFYGAHIPYYVVSGFTWCLKSNGTYYYQCGEVYLTENCIKYNSTYALGRKVDTRYIKDFVLSATENVAAGDLVAVVVAFDAAGAILSSGVTGTSTSPFSTSNLTYNAAIYGGGFTATLLDFCTIHLADTVKSIWVGVQTDGYGTNVTSISLRSASSHAPPPSYPGYDLVTEGAYSEIDTLDVVAESIPVGGAFNNGTRIWDLNPAGGAVPGWVVANRVTTAANGGEPATETAIAVDDDTGISNGDTIGLVINDGTYDFWYWTTVNGAPAANVVTITDGIPAAHTLPDNATVISYNLKTMAVLGA